MIIKNLLTGAIILATWQLSSATYANVTGMAYSDFNGDGIQQAGESGRGGIIVKAYL